MAVSKKLTLAFSALGNRLSDLSMLLSDIESTEHCEVLVIVQRWNESHLDIKDKFPRIKFVFQDGKGLSRSRNAALSCATGDYIWLLDDDVQITPNDISDLINVVQENPDVDGFRVRIGCIEWQDKFFKAYKTVKKVSRLNMLQVSSIEVILRRKFIEANDISFNENIGLGTDYQGGEEIHFLIDAYDSGAKFLFLDRAFIRHTCIFDERVLATNNIFEIRGATASRFGIIGPLLMLRWALRYLIKERNISFIFSMFKGYFSGYKAFK